jgi:hypothetical protein
VKRVHAFCRHRKLDLFFQAFNPKPTDILLDVGGDYGGLHGEYMRLHGFFARTVVVNLRPRPAISDKRISLEQGDARALPYPDQSFDWVFSNAVIEHVGTAEDQAAMAAEVRRVARKGYFVTTPNRWFPIDPHNYHPIVHMFSRQRYHSGVHSCRFLSPGDMRALFPGAALRYGPLASTILAYDAGRGHEA